MYLKKIVFLFLVLTIFGGMGLVLFSNDQYFGSLYFRNSSIIPISLIIIILITIKNDLQIEKITKIFLLSSGVFCALLLMNYMFRSFHELTLINTIMGNRLGGQPTFPFKFKVQYDPVSLGIALSNLAPFFLSFLIYYINKAKKVIYFVPFLLILLVIFLTGTRSAWIACIVSSGIVLLFSADKKGKKRIYIILVILIGVGIQYQSFYLNPALAERVSSFIKIQSTINFLSRLELFKLGVTIFFKNPLGIGYGRLNRVISNEHNMYTFIALGSGIVGILAFLGILIIIFKILVKGFKNGMRMRFKKALCLGGIGTIIALAINGMADPLFIEAFGVNSTFISLSIALSAAYMIIDSKHKNLFYNKKINIHNSKITHS